MIMLRLELLMKLKTPDAFFPFSLWEKVPVGRMREWEISL